MRHSLPPVLAKRADYRQLARPQDAQHHQQVRPFRGHPRPFGQLMATPRGPVVAFWMAGKAKASGKLSRESTLFRTATESHLVISPLSGR